MTLPNGTSLSSRTLANVVDYVKRQFGDESGVQLTVDDITRWTNQAIMEINSKNLVLRAAAAQDAAVGVEAYAKPNDCLKVTSVALGGLVLKPVGFDEYQAKKSVDVTQVDSPTYWTQYADSIYINAAPTDTSRIDIYYIPEPLFVSSLDATLPLPDRYFDRICEYVMSKAYEMDEDWQAHSVQRQLFEDSLTTLGNAENAMDGPFPVVTDYSYD
jgi:hypothetical protein